MTSESLAAIGVPTRPWPRFDTAILVMLNVVGAGTYLYPFIVTGVLDPGSNWYEHRGDGPLLMAGVAALGLALVISQMTGERLNTRSLATLGVLAAMAAVLRTITLPAGANLYFVLVITGSWVFGARLGFLLGTLSFVLSAIVTGGLGPWLPFQMFASGWVGLTAGWAGTLSRRHLGSTSERWFLAGFGFAWGLAFGAILNLWFWPFWVGGPDVTFNPAVGLVENVRRYWNFYLLASAGWDLMRAIFNALALAFLGGPLLKGLRRFHARFDWTTA